MAKEGAGGRGRAPLGLVGALALIAVMELGVEQSRETFATFITASWQESGRAARDEAVGADVLCLGDSQIKSGLLPRTLEQRLHGPAFNLAVVGGQPASSYFLLGRALRAGARPRAIIVDFYPGLLACDCRINTRQWPELLTLGETLDLIATTRDARLAGPLVVQTVLPTLLMRSEIRAAMTAALQGVIEPDGDKARAYRRNWRLNAGAHALPVNPGFRDEGGTPLAGLESAAGLRWRSKPENLVFIRRFLALAEAHGIAVFWLLPTNSPGLRDVRERDGRDRVYEQLVRAIQNEFPRIVVLDPQPVLCDPAVFSDVCHLDRRGAESLSMSVADALASHQRTDRWVALSAPPTSARFAGARLEDVAQSAEVLRSEAGADRARPLVAAKSQISPRR